jgi:hypothetical protein
VAYYNSQINIIGLRMSLFLNMLKTASSMIIAYKLFIGLLKVWNLSRENLLDDYVHIAWKCHF